MTFKVPQHKTSPLCRVSFFLFLCLQNIMFLFYYEVFLLCSYSVLLILVLYLCLKGSWRINFQTHFICLWVTVIFHVPLAIAFTASQSLFLKTVWLPLQLLKHSPVYLWFSAMLLERWKCQAGWQLMNWVLSSPSHWFYQKSFSNKFEIITFGSMRSLAFSDRRIDTSQNGSWYWKGHI